MEGAPCAEDPDAFQLPSQNLSVEDRKRLEHAKLLCRSRCGVQEKCLLYALDEKIKDGIWGGMTGSKRQAFLRKRNRLKKAAAVEAGTSATKR